MNSLKKSIEPFGLSYLIKVMMQTPDFLRCFILEDFVDKMTFGFSNVPGPKQPFKVAGFRCQSQGFIMPVGKTCMGSFSILSHDDVVKMVISMDKKTMESTEEITEYLCKALDEILGTPEWRKYGETRTIR